MPFKTHFTRLSYAIIFRVYNKFELVFANVHLRALKRSNNNKKKENDDESESLSILAETLKKNFSKIEK